MNLFSLEKLEKICPNYGAWDGIWGGRMNVNPGYVFESGTAFIADTNADGDIEGNKEALVPHTVTTEKLKASSKKRGYWNQSDDIINLGQQRNDIMRDRMEQKYKYLDKKAEEKIQVARFEAEAKNELKRSRLETKTKTEVTRMRLEMEKIKLERERIRFEAAKLNLAINLPKLDNKEEEEEESDEE